MKTQFVLWLTVVVLAVPIVASADKDHKNWIPVESMSQSVQPKHGDREKIVLSYDKLVWDTVVESKKQRAPQKAVRGGGNKKMPPEASKLIQDGERFMNTVLRTNGNISPTQEKAYQQEMSALIVRMDQLLINSYSVGGGGAEGPAACMQECDSAYPGIGGGNGWNRFLCKGACLKINIGPVGAGGN